MSPSSEADRSFEHILVEYAEAVSGKTGQAFFGSLVRHMARALDADYALVGALQPDGERIATLAVMDPMAKPGSWSTISLGRPAPR
jgi:hypothetical protein